MIEDQVIISPQMMCLEPIEIRSDGSDFVVRDDLSRNQFFWKDPGQLPRSASRTPFLTRLPPHSDPVTLHQVL